LDVPAVQVLVGLCSDVFNDVRHSQHKLVFNWRNPRIVVQLEDGSGAEEVKAAKGRRQHCQSVSLKVKLSQSLKLSQLLRHIHELVVSESENSKISQILYFGAQCLKLVVTEVERSQGAHDEEVAGQRILAQVVVREVQYLNGREGAKSPGKIIQLVDAQVEYPEFWHSRQRDGHLLQGVVEQVEDLHVLQVCYRRWQLRDLVVAEGQPRDVLHPPQLGHVGLQRDQGLVREVQLSILHPRCLLQGLLDDLGGHDDTPLSDLEPR